MKYDRSMLYFALGGSLFIGFICVAVSIGAIVPSIHKLTAPLICRGEVQVETVRYNVRPGETVWDHSVYCVTDGAKKEITFPAIGITGLAASAIVFAVLAWRWRGTLVVPMKDFGSLATDLKAAPSSPGESRRKKKQGSPLERLSELKKMRDENLISEAEYDRKKNEIMEEL